MVVGVGFEVIFEDGGGEVGEAKGLAGGGGIGGEGVWRMIGGRRRHIGYWTEIPRRRGYEFQIWR